MPRLHGRILGGNPRESTGNFSLSGVPDKEPWGDTGQHPQAPTPHGSGLCYAAHGNNSSVFRAELRLVGRRL